MEKRSLFVLRSRRVGDMNATFFRTLEASSFDRRPADDSA